MKKMKMNTLDMVTGSSSHGVHLPRQLNVGGSVVPGSTLICEVVVALSATHICRESRYCYSGTVIE